MINGLLVRGNVCYLYRTLIVDAEKQLHDIISASDAWTIMQDTPEDEESLSRIGLRPTISSRQVKALIEQITGEFTFLNSCQIDIHPFHSLNIGTHSW
jgi:hypothetical protein